MVAEDAATLPSSQSSALISMHNGGTVFLPARQIPKDLLNKIQITLEEKLYSRALYLLLTLGYSGLSTSSRQNSGIKEIYVPPPIFLSIITTIAFHPELTTNLTRSQTSAPAHRAVQYLEHLIAVVGPVNAGLRDAWRFERKRNAADQTGLRRRRRRSPSPIENRRRNQDLSEIAMFEYLDIAHHESLFSRVEDIWDVIGWAFVCSVVHKQRWQRWKLFLVLLLDALEKDWMLRYSDHNDVEDADLEESLANSIGFIPELTGSAGYKRVIRAIFANGSEKSTREWQTVFQYEVSKKPKREKAETDYDPDSQGSSYSLYGKLKKDIKKGGNYDMILDRVNHDMEDDSDSDDATSVLKEIFLQGDEDEDMSSVEGEELREDPSESWGGLEAIVLRQRLVNMLSTLFTYDERTLNSFFTEFGDVYRQMPVAEMMLFTTTLCPMEANCLASIIQIVLRPLLERQPNGGYKSDVLDDTGLMEWYLPYAATRSDIESNAKVAVLLEALTRLWHTKSGVGMAYSKSMEDAMEKGIAARASKIKKQETRREGKNDEAKNILDMSEIRLRLLMDDAKQKQMLRRQHKHKQ